MEMLNNKLNITIHRKFCLHGMLVTFYIVFNYDVEEFNQLINKYNNDEITKEQLKSELKEITIIPIKNNESKRIEILKNNTKVFVTNVNIENTKRYPLVCSNQLVISENAKLNFEISKAQNVLEVSLTNITNDEKNGIKDNNTFGLTRKDVNIWTTNDQLISLYKFGIPGEELREKKMRSVMNLGVKTRDYGDQSFICSNVYFKKYNDFDMVVFTDKNNQIKNLWPIILRQPDMGIQYVYDLLIQYNEQHKEYNLVRINELDNSFAQKLETSGLSGDIHTLEMFLNYGIGMMKTQETYYLLTNSKAYNINGFKLVRDGEKVSISIEDEFLKDCINSSKCEILDEAFKLIIEYWYKI